MSDEQKEREIIINHNGYKIEIKIVNDYEQTKNIY